MAEAEQGEWVELFRSIPLTEDDQVVKRVEPARFRDGNNEAVDWTEGAQRRRALAQGIAEPQDPPQREAKIVFFNPATGSKREERIPANVLRQIRAWLEDGVRRVQLHPDAVRPGDPDYIELPFTADDLGRLPVGLLLGQGKKEES